MTITTTRRRFLAGTTILGATLAAPAVLRAQGGDLAASLHVAFAGLPHTTHIVVEVDRLDQLAEVLEEGGADVVLLDNMDTAMLSEAVAMVGGRLVTEASGNMTLERIAEVAATGVGYISSGALTHSARTLDLGLDF